MINFNIAEHLTSDEDIREFLQEVANTGNSSDFLHAVDIAARAKGMAVIANEAFSKDGQPAFDTVFNLIKSFGLNLSVSNQQASSS